MDRYGRGVREALADRSLPSAYAQRVAEDWGWDHDQEAYADRDAAWRTQLASPKQRDLPARLRRAHAAGPAPRRRPGPHPGRFAPSGPHVPWWSDLASSKQIAWMEALLNSGRSSAAASAVNAITARIASGARVVPHGETTIARPDSAACKRSEQRWMTHWARSGRPSLRSIYADSARCGAPALAGRRAEFDFWRSPRHRPGDRPAGCRYCLPVLADGFRVVQGFGQECR